MVKSTKKDAHDVKTEDNAENRERQRLRKLAFSRKLISQTRSNPSRPLQPTKAILNCDGKDIVKKGQRKNKYLFSFPCLIAPVSGGKMGELVHLDTKNPVLYVDFPQGRLKFFGTIIYPKNKYLTLHFMRGSGNVVCEDSFDSLVVFSDVWWIGTKEENPEEVQLDFPKELKQEKHAEFDFKGGAGTVAHHKSVAAAKLPSKECDVAINPETDFKLDQLQDSQQPKPRISKHDIESLEEEIKPTPVRSSARTAGKTFKFADSPSEDDIDSTGNDSSSSDTGQAQQAKKQKVNRNLGTALDEAVAEDFTPALIDTRHDKKKTALDEVQNASSSARKTPSSQKKPKETPSKLVGTTKTVLVQSSMSSFLQKPEEKSSQKSEKTPVGTKGSAQRRRSTDLKGKSKKTKDVEEKLSDEDIIEEAPKESKKVVRRTSGRGESTSKGKQIKSPIKLDSSDEEKTSSEPEEGDDSDEDWTG